ncbi:MAG: tetratricopeptide repeat protein [Prevotellaceae bacterium]|jgi:tetratricopeptide (TPR) repeat protein|nr:tetratricopeptide repeat protein [Prevotellaceae bacterium]
MTTEEKEKLAQEYFKQGYDCADKGDYDKAIEYYNKVIELKPDTETAYNNLGIAYHNKGDNDKAIEYYKKAIELKPDDAFAYSNLGLAYDNTGNYDKAIEYYKKAIELKPDDAITYYNFGIVYYHKGDNDKAIGYWNETIILKPDYTDAYYNLGFAYYNKGDNDKAIEYYNKAVELKPDFTNAYNNLGVAYYYKGDYDKAIEYYNKAVELKPDDATVYNNIGEAYYYKGDYDKAIEYWNKAIELKPDDAMAYYNLGDAYRKKGDYDKAIEYYNKAIEIDDKYFSQTLQKYNVSKDNPNFTNYKQIYGTSYCIMRLLHVSNTEETLTGFAHYTRKETAEKLLIKDKEDKTSPFRLNSITTSNDPTEGEIAFDYLGLENKTTNKDYQAFIACFTFDPECLNQFRLYGKEQGKEATGVSILFKKTFFAEKPTGLAAGLLMSGSDSVIRDSKTETKEDYALYRCIYIDPVTKQIISLGHKDDYTFFRDVLNGKKDGEKLSEKKQMEINKITKYKKEINHKLKDIRKEFNELKKLINKVKGEKALICDLLINLRYLVKHVAFNEEQECRVVKVAKLSDHAQVKLDGDNIFINTRSIVDYYVDKVYFAPKAADIELFQEKLGYDGVTDIQCLQCTHPIRLPK